MDKHVIKVLQSFPPHVLAIRVSVYESAGGMLNRLLLIGSMVAAPPADGAAAITRGQ